MSILAEPKRKKRISVDPQNQQWAQDESKFGKKMMEKMGWSHGEGLGKGGRGMTENLKLKANTSGKGLGAIASYDSTWIAHHDDFADLLSALNKNKPNKEDDDDIVKEKASQVSLELKSKSLKRRIHYQKFTRAKDITEYDDNAKKAVLGIGINKRDKQKKAEQNEEITKPESSDSVELSSQKHSISSVSAGDYYKDKMAAKLAALREASSGLIDQSKKTKKCIEETVVDAQEESTMELGEEPKKKKKKRHLEGPDADQKEPLVELDEEPKKKKKKRHVEGDDVVDQEEEPKKKKKNRHLEGDDVESQEEKPAKKEKSKKK